MSKLIVTRIFILCTPVLLTVTLLSQRNQSSFKIEFELKSPLPPKHLHTLVSTHAFPFFYCSYLRGFTFIYIKLYFVPVVWFWTDPAPVSRVKFVFYLPDNESRRRSCVTQSSSHFHVTNKERKKSSAKCVFTTVVSLVAASMMNHSISFNLAETHLTVT